MDDYQEGRLGDEEYHLVESFYIESDDSIQHMDPERVFTLGFEHRKTLQYLDSGEPFSIQIHGLNLDRARKAAEHRRIKFQWSWVNDEWVLFSVHKKGI